MPSNEECWQAFLDSRTTGIAIANSNGRYVTTNATFREILGYQESEIDDMLLSNFTDDKESRHYPFAELIKRGEGYIKIEKHHRRNNESFIWLNAGLFCRSCNTNYDELCGCTRGR